MKTERAKKIAYRKATCCLTCISFGKNSDGIWHSQRCKKLDVFVNSNMICNEYSNR